MIGPAAAPGPSVCPSGAACGNEAINTAVFMEEQGVLALAAGCQRFLSRWHPAKLVTPGFTDDMNFEECCTFPGMFGDWQAERWWNRER